MLRKNANQMSWQLQLEPSFFEPLLDGFDPLFLRRTALTAYSNTSFKPYLVSALHYKYLHFSSFSKTAFAVSLVMGADFGSFAFFVA